MAKRRPHRLSSICVSSLLSVSLLVCVALVAVVASSPSAIAIAAEPAPLATSCSPQSPELSRCSHRGIFYADLGSCECFPCYSGESCGNEDKNCTVSASVADGFLFEDYFLKHWDHEGLTYCAPGWAQMGYFYPLMQIDSVLNRRIKSVLFGLHESTGNAAISPGPATPPPRFRPGGMQLDGANVDDASATRVQRLSSGAKQRHGGGVFLAGGERRLVRPQQQQQSPSVAGQRMSNGKQGDEREAVATNLVIGAGSTMVIRSLLASIARKEGRVMHVYARAPYYPMFRFWSDENPSLTVFTQREDLDPASVIEIITFPNNPDFQRYAPVYPTAKYKIYDMVYYWPHLTPVNVTLDEDIMVFSSSKLTGHAASRFGWALVKDASIAMGTLKSTREDIICPSIDGILRQLQVLEYIQDPLRSSFFEEAREGLELRWKELRSVFARQKLPARFVLHGENGSWFAWVACARLGEGETCQSVFKAALIGGEYGEGEMGVKDFIRLNLNLHTSTWPLFMDRMTKLLLAQEHQAAPVVD